MGDLKHGLVDGGVDLQVIEFDHGDLPRALTALAALIELGGCQVQNLWLGAPPAPGRDRLWFTSIPAARRPAVPLAPPPADATPVVADEAPSFLVGV